MGQARVVIQFQKGMLKLGRFGQTIVDLTLKGALTRLAI